MQSTEKQRWSPWILLGFPFYHFCFSVCHCGQDLNHWPHAALPLFQVNLKKGEKHTHTTHIGNQFCQNAQSARQSWLHIHCDVSQISMIKKGCKYRPACNTLLLQRLPLWFRSEGIKLEESELTTCTKCSTLKQIFKISYGNIFRRNPGKNVETWYNNWRELYWSPGENWTSNFVKYTCIL